MQNFLTRILHILSQFFPDQGRHSSGVPDLPHRVRGRGGGQPASLWKTDAARGDHLPLGEPHSPERKTELTCWVYAGGTRRGASASTCNIEYIPNNEPLTALTLVARNHTVACLRLAHLLDEKILESFYQ